MDIIDRKERYHSERRYGGNWLAVLRRDGHRCVECGTNQSVRVHHRRGTSFNDLHDLVTLCAHCHAQAHGRAIGSPALALRAAAMIDLRNDGYTFQEIGSSYGVSRERVYQIMKAYSEQYL
jgi:5-methylcytosine-specific restriction endonuclease McrA